ncbi:MAG: hydrolase [Candidatus Eremiobacteraeota bacterium]|nr:hydrolase [Candidatus Eremiobacteraeota bacterium]
MPVTEIDPTSALVVIDIQKGIVGMPTVHPAAGVLANVVRLVDAFRAANKPVVLVRVGWTDRDMSDAVQTRNQGPGTPGPLPPDFFEYADELQADPARDVLVHKRQWGAFYGTDLDLQLRRRGITQIVLCGIATSIGVESTARSAYEHNYHLTFASDAMTDRNADAHDRALDIIFPRIGEIGTTDEILAKLGR